MGEAARVSGDCSMNRLSRKTALVTGGASGLGRAIAERLASEGANVIFTDIRLDLGKAVAAESGLLFLEQDVCDERRWPQVISEVEARYGRLDVLVNNAGILGAHDAASPENTTLSNWRRVFSVNVESVFLGCRAAIPAMRKTGSGSIINISSIAGLLATPYNTAYGASKATVRQLTKSVAQHCAEERLAIRCNSVHPGNVLTPLWRDLAEQIAKKGALSVEEIIAQGKAEAPMGDFVFPEDVAAAVAFLASDESRYMTGAEMIIDGGIMHCDTYHLKKHVAASRKHV